MPRIEKLIRLIKINSLISLKANLILPSFFLGVLLIGCSTESENNKIPALFDTKVEAEKAAKDFNCTGAHEMGNKWMPCESHNVHEEHKKDNVHGHDHNH